MTSETRERPLAHPDTPRQPETREAHDARHKPALQHDPGDKNAQLDIELDESFPASDPPSNTQPGKSGEPAPSTGFRDDGPPPPLDGE